MLFHLSWWKKTSLLKWHWTRHLNEVREPATQIWGEVGVGRNAFKMLQHEQRSWHGGVLGRFDAKGPCGRSEVREGNSGKRWQQQRQPRARCHGFLKPGKDFGFYSMFDRKSFWGLWAEEWHDPINVQKDAADSMLGEGESWGAGRPLKKWVHDFKWKVTGLD